LIRLTVPHHGIGRQSRGDSRGCARQNAQFRDHSWRRRRRTYCRKTTNSWVDYSVAELPCLLTVHYRGRQTRCF